MSLTLRPALLAPPRPPNLFRFSEQFNQANWVKTRATVSADAAVAPGGATTADKLVEDGTAANTHGVTQSVALQQGAHILTFYAKAGERAMLRVRNSGTALYAAYIDLAAAAIFTVASGSWVVADAGNGWVAVRATFVVGAPTALVNGIYLSDGVGDTYNGDGVSGAYLWGAQLTRGASPQPYQATV